ncbi:MAG: 3-phosphoshikimate 1-carboxyvinyltransferase [Acidobacteriota bacterium]
MRRIRPAARLRGELTVPGDKSISHRALMLASIADGTTRILNIAPGRDVRSTANCLARLGVSIHQTGSGVAVHGRGLCGFEQPADCLDAGNSGTTVRLLSGILAAHPFESVITGDESLRRRPMARVLEPLRRMGASIDADRESRAPLRIRGGRLRPIHHALPVASAQVKSCVLLAGLHADGETSIEEPWVSRNHTELMLPLFGVVVRADGPSSCVSGPARLRATTIDVAGDPSSAAFFLVAACVLPGSELIIRDVCVNPTRTGLLRVLGSMGARLSFEGVRIVGGEPRADIVVRSSRLHGAAVPVDLIPSIIDELPLLAVAATQAEGETVVRGAAELRVKEADRIHAVVRNLGLMGAHATELNDGFVICGSQRLRGVVVDSFGDHRIAMAFAVAGLVAEGETMIAGAGSADVSYPGFYDALDEVIDG